MDLISLHDIPESEDRYTVFLRDVCEKFEFDHAAYAGVNPVGGTMHAIVTYSEDWQNYYLENNLHLIDPTIHSAMRSVAPVDWLRLNKDKNFRKVFDSAREFGVGEKGLTIPIRGPFGEFGMLSVTRDCSQEEWIALRNEKISDLQQAAAHIHDNVMHAEPLSRYLHHPKLSKRELEVLQWLAAGRSQQDVADMLSISTRTVEVHVRSAREKLVALTTSQAVGRAIGMKLIFPG